ncbi:Phosphoadenylyl-sulfate reductase [thioredoxin] (EC [Amycolatopsis camponoti]|uniref:Adenosine 5'-phosphosulfate reductase n=1 Tax=Amycolatopsis camponoti TaxID=2606593 RepID=A0A6I8LW48_9PSEU|nr:phosphoadenylyl-sulfate reductase [Amycolatopsis camponoti]VVJ20638.1 Phosphoadenylyl-sulfate reductase [thioredoxin] (EC [Amycolatopsis camponoti]
MTATADYKTLAERASKELAEATADEAIRWTVDTFGEDFIVASNMQDAVLIDLATKVKSDVDILFLETGYHFPETIGTRDAVQAVYPDVKIVNAQAEQSVAEQDAEYGEKLHDRDPTLCCNLRKVVPLRKTLANYSAWITGVRRVDAPTRANTPIVTWDDRNGLVKINPIAAWTDDEFNGYIRDHSILENPLVSIGYLSIGCAPCTARVEPGQDPRSGRWAGQSKTECGLHG